MQFLYLFIYLSKYKRENIRNVVKKVLPRQNFYVHIFMQLRSLKVFLLYGRTKFLKTFCLNIHTKRRQHEKSIIKKSIIALEMIYIMIKLCDIIWISRYEKRIKNRSKVIAVTGRESIKDTCKNLNIVN